MTVDVRHHPTERRPAGRTKKDGTMKELTGAEFEKRAQDALGGRGWQKAMAAALGVDASTIRRWTSGFIPVPTYACAILELLEATPSAFRPPRWLKVRPLA